MNPFPICDVRAWRCRRVVAVLAGQLVVRGVERLGDASGLLLLLVVAVTCGFGSRALGELSSAAEQRRTNPEESNVGENQPPHALRPAWLTELIADVERHEDQYKDLALDLTSKYRQGTTEMVSRLELKLRLPRFRLQETTSSHNMLVEEQVEVLGNAAPDKPKRRNSSSQSFTVFDGRTTRLLGLHTLSDAVTGELHDTSQNGAVSDEPPSLSNLVRPHMFLLESGCPRVPLSTYLQGIQAVLSYPGINFNETGPIRVRDLGAAEFMGLRCQRILIDQIIGGRPYNGWELWLALDRNLIPVRNLAYTYRWSKELPVAEATVDQWKELSPGVWYPTKARKDRYHSRIVKQQQKQILTWRKFYLVTDVSLAPEVQAQTFTKLDFPSGTKITFTKNGASTSKVQP